MKTLKGIFIPILLGIILVTSIYGCVMILAVSETVKELEENDKQMMDHLESNMLNPPDSMPQLSDSLAYYKSERKLIKGDYNYGDSWVTVHRFFFKRSEYTEKLFGGFSIIIADFNTKGVFLETQDNVTLATTNLGDTVTNWETKLDSLTVDRSQYIDFSDNGLKARTFIRSNKF